MQLNSGVAGTGQAAAAQAAGRHAEIAAILLDDNVGRELGCRYTVNGYKGKQVRDNIAAADVSRFIECFRQRPRIAAVYNIGGGKENTVSIIEAFDMVAKLTGEEMIWTYQETARDGDHICCYSDLRRIRADYPEWRVTRNLATILTEIVAGWQRRLQVA